MHTTIQKITGSDRLPNWRGLDLRVFTWMGAGHDAKPALLSIAKPLSRWGWVPLAALLLAVAQTGALGWSAWGRCLMTVVLVQTLSKWISRRWRAARPFALGLGQNHLNHSLRAGFPSTHAMVMGAILGFMALSVPADLVLAGIATIALGTGWARIYVGAHFPLDVLAGLVLGGVIGLAVALTTIV